MKNPSRTRNSESEYIKKVCKERQYERRYKEYFLDSYRRTIVQESKYIKKEVSAVKAACIKCQDYDYHFVERIITCKNRGCPLWYVRPWKKEQPRHKGTLKKPDQKVIEKLEDTIDIPDAWLSPSN